MDPYGHPYKGILHSSRGFDDFSDSTGHDCSMCTVLRTLFPHVGAIVFGRELPRPRPWLQPRLQNGVGLGVFAFRFGRVEVSS